MSRIVNVAIHASQFPDAVRRDLLESLRRRQVNHKFHYDSVKQTQKWLALHRDYSPAKKDPDYQQAYTRAIRAAANAIRVRQIQVVGLCCGDGAKEAQLLRTLIKQGKDVSYLPCDSSLPMVLFARQAVRGMIPDDHCYPVVCDLETARDLAGFLDEVGGTEPRARLITIFGTLHNYPPRLIASRLAALLRPEDYLLIGTNLAPPLHYAPAVKRIARQYNNQRTYDWLCVLLSELGFPLKAGQALTEVEPCEDGMNLKRIAVHFQLSRACALQVAECRLRFEAGERLRLFFSYRYTPAKLAVLLRREGVRIRNQWVTASEEEGVFLCQRF